MTNPDCNAEPRCGLDVIAPASSNPLALRPGRSDGLLYSWGGGTSYSVPVTVGVIALMLNANDDLGTEEVRAILRDTAEFLPHIAPEFQGAGLINAKAAVDAAKASSDDDSDDDSDEE